MLSIYHRRLEDSTAVLSILTNRACNALREILLAIPLAIFASFQTIKVFVELPRLSVLFGYLEGFCTGYADNNLNKRFTKQ